MMPFVDPRTPVLGSIVGPWLLLGRIDSGSYGVVFRARRADDPEAPPVALKVAKNPGDPRFEREAEVLRRTRHPGVPHYEDFGHWVSPSGALHPYIVMELVEGFILYDWFREQPRSSQQVLRVLEQVARGLVAVHAQGIVHRDLKGDNIRVTPEGRAVLVDFGSGWYPDAEPITDTIIPPGTSIYRAPEVLRFLWRHRRDEDARWVAQPSDDLYALGVTAYRLVTGTYPPPVSETGDLRGVLRRLPRPSELAMVSPELDALIMPLLSEDAAARGSTETVAEALERAARQEGLDATRPILPTSAGAHTEETRLSKPPGSSSASDSGSSSSASDSGSSSELPRRRPSTASGRREAGDGFPPWVSSGIAALMGSMILGVCTGIRQHVPPEQWSAIEERHQPSREVPDAGVAEEALLSVESYPQASVPSSAVALPMPKGPLPGQKKPPCEPGYELAALGACWLVSFEKKPPCGSFGYEYDGKCVRASFAAPRAPTSGEP